MYRDFFNKSRFGTLLVLVAMALMAGVADQPYERAPVSYSTAVPQDAIAKIQEQLATGKIGLEGDERQVLRSLLAALNIPEASQVLVFSKTSLQRDLIDPAHPRALYFSDDVYVGWCPGGLAEVAAIDPVLGPVFYKFDPRAIKTKSLFQRDPDCLRCHGGTFVRDIPALLARSVHTDATGEPVSALGSELVDSTTPFSRRYGGWYVTGLNGSVRHLGNVVLKANRTPTDAELVHGNNVKSLSPFFDTRPYLAETSDLVALLVFEHQVTVQNVLTKANQHCMALMAYQQGVQRDLQERVTEEPTFESVDNAFVDAVQQVLDALLSKDEAPLPEGGVKGIGGFTEAFGRETRSKNGEPTLKDLDLKQRVLKYRCSYLIQSSSFDRLQPALRKRVLRRLRRVLSDPANDQRYAYLEPAERLAIRKIVGSTVRNLPPNWKSDR